MKKCIALIIGLSISICSFSQKSTKDYIDIESTTLIEGLNYNMEKDDYTAYSDIISCYNDDTLFFLRADFNSPETIRMYAFTVKTNTYSYQDFDARKMIKEDGKSYYIDRFAINKDYLVIPANKGYIGGDFLFFYKRIGKDFIYDFEVNVKNDEFSQRIEFLPNGKLLGLKNYVYVEEKPEESSSLSILNLETKKVEKTINLEFLLPLYTLRYPYNILSVNDNSILFSQRGDYKISEFDFDLNLIGTIENKEVKWDRMPQEISDSIHINQKYAVNRIHSLSRIIDNYSCVHNIYSSKDKLFVFYSKKGNYEKYYYDIWAKQNGNWTLIKKNISDYPKSVRKANKQTLTFMNSGRCTYFLGNKFLRLCMILPDLGAYPKLIYMIKAQKYISNNNIPYGVEIINFKGL